MIDVKDIKVWSDPSTIEVDGRTYTYRSAPDEDSSIFDDGDWCGELIWTRNTQERPGDFDGGAEILVRDGYSRLWWQPPADVKRGTENFTNLRRYVLDALDHGYEGVIVEDQDGNTESVWGFIWSDDEAQADTVANLIDVLHAAHLADRATWADSFI